MILRCKQCKHIYDSEDIHECVTKEYEEQRDQMIDLSARAGEALPDNGLEFFSELERRKND